MAALRVSASEIFRLNHWFQSGPASTAAAAWKSGGGSGWKTMPTEASTSVPGARGLKSFTSRALCLVADRRTPATGPTKTGSADGRNLGGELSDRGRGPGQALAKETKKEPNSTGSKQSGISPCFHAPGIFTTRNPGALPQRLWRSASLKTRQ